MKVLIVDDAPTNLKLLRAMLEAENAAVVEASDGLQALAVLEHEKVDAVISDILMPRMDGYRLCYEVRRSEQFRLLPFIFYTATYTSPSDEKLSYELGGDKYLQKPASAEAILSALSEAANSAARRPMKRSGTLSDCDVMKEYSERLVSKLESKNVELMEAKKQLEETNRELERAGVQLQQANAGLELRVRQRTSELEAANQELEAFSYSVSHDLRAPLRHIASFSGLVLNNSAAQLDKANLRHLNAIGVAAERMSGLIEALLQLSRVSRGKLSRQPVDLTALAGEVLAELQQSAPRHGADVSIAPGITAEGDQRLLRIVLTNLLGNAWKFTSKRAGAQIEFGIAQNETDSPYFVRDNGAGFDMAYVNNLFTAFQRLHCQDEFEGTGVGLATVQRIIRRHGGKIWAQGAPNEGAAFFFTLGEEKNHENTHCR